MKQIILNETVSCSLVLAVVTGLPYSGKSHILKEFLHSVLLHPLDGSSVYKYEEAGLSSCRICLLGRKPYDDLIWLAQSPSSAHTFSIASSVFHDSLLKGQEVELSDKIIEGQYSKEFESSLLNYFLHKVYADIDRVVRRADLNRELKRILPSGITQLTVFDVGVNKGVHDFLCLVACYYRRMFELVVLRIDDIQDLGSPPNLSHERYANTANQSILQGSSRLFYLLRFAAVAQQSTGRSDSVVFLVTHDGTKSQQHIDQAKIKLKQSLEEEAHRQKIDVQLVSKVVMVQLNSNEDIAKLKKQLEKEVMDQRTMRIDNLKLSWVILRSLFYTDQHYIETSRLKALAEELDIEDEEFEAFLSTFTEFGSILHIPDIETLKKIVVLHPGCFINALSKLFYPPEGVDYKDHDGLLTEEQIAAMVEIEQPEIITSTLCDFGLAVEVHESQLQTQQASLPRRSEIDFTLEDVARLKLKGKKEERDFLFVPSSRAKCTKENLQTDSLAILYDTKLIPPDMPAVFVRYFLSARAKLIPSLEAKSVNLQVPIKSSNCNIILVFHCKFVEIRMERYNPADIKPLGELIVSCCTKAIVSISKFIKDLSYKFVIPCVKPQRSSDKDLPAFEDLPTNKLCYACEAQEKKNPVRSTWKEIINEVQLLLVFY